ncbi:MAG: class I SAM-dependent methyltransferase, partial [Kiritimatiellia bacterium]
MLEVPRDCPICPQGGQPAVEVAGLGFDIIRCMDCGLFYQRSHPNSAPVDPYGSLYDDTPGVETLGQALLDRYAIPPLKAVALDIARAGYQGGNLLDVGCAHGLLVGYMNRQGWTASGIDLSENATRWARAQRLDCRCLAIEDFHPQKPYDVIVLKHVLEHLQNPIAMLQHLATWLTKTGMIYVRVPNAASWAVTLSRRSFIGHLKPFEHLFYYTPASLSRLCAAAGLNVQVEVAKRHTISDLINYQIRSRIVLREAWNQIRYPGEKQSQNRLHCLLMRTYSTLLGIPNRISIGPPDAELVAYIR